MSRAYTQAQKNRYRITLSLTIVGEDFHPENIDWEKLLDLQGGESVDAYVEHLNVPDRYFS